MALIKLWREFVEEFNEGGKQIDADVHKRIFGSHATAYMTTLMEDSELINKKTLHPKCLGNIPAIEMSWAPLREVAMYHAKLAARIELF